MSNRSHNISSNPVFVKAALSNSRGTNPSQIHPLTKLANVRSGDHIILSHSQNKNSVNISNAARNRAAVLLSPR